MIRCECRIDGVFSLTAASFSTVCSVCETDIGVIAVSCCWLEPGTAVIRFHNLFSSARVFDCVRLIPLPTSSTDP
jgi:hypothetical protein